MSAVIDSRQHYYLVKCGWKDCKYIEKCAGAPLKAHRRAEAHAVRYPSHRVYVFNLSLLTVVAFWENQSITRLVNASLV